MNLEKLLHIYFKNISDQLQPFRENILKKLKLEPDIDIKNPQFPEGSNSNNRLKYFDQKRPYLVCKAIAKIWKDLIPGKKTILDLGCGIGDFSAMFKALGHNVYGVNGGETWYLDDFKYCNDLLGINVIILDIKKPTPFVNKRFDIVFASEILTLGTLLPLQTQILDECMRIGKKVIAVNHHNRQLQERNNLVQYFSPEV